MASTILPDDPSTPLTDTIPPPAPTSSTIRIATRRSHLARIQASLVARQIRTRFPQYSTQIVGVDATADLDKTTPLHAFNAKALWTTELEELLTAGSADLIVHSLKDMPTQLPAGLALAAVTEREDPRDAVCFSPSARAAGVVSLAQLKDGDVVGTGSLRRVAQLKRRYPGLVFRDSRGNVGTRLEKLDREGGEFKALILAAAGLRRLGLQARIDGLLSWADGGVMHAIGQGALGIEIREGDERLREVCEGILDERAFRQTLAERSLLRTLEGGCSVPIGAETEWVKKGAALATVGGSVGVMPRDDYDAVKGEAGKDGREQEVDDRSDELILRAVVVSLDGTRAVERDMLRTIRSREEADQYGWDMAQRLVEGGAADILESIKLNRKIVQEQGNA